MMEHKFTFKTGVIPKFSVKNILIGSNDIGLNLYSKDLIKIETINPRSRIVYLFTELEIIYQHNKDIILYNIKTKERSKIPLNFFMGVLQGKIYYIFNIRTKEVKLYNIENHEIIIDYNIESDDNMSMCVFLKDYIYYSGKNSPEIFCLNLQTGEQKWTFSPNELDLGREFNSFGTYFILNNLLIGHNEHRCWYAVKTENKELVWSCQMPDKVITSKKYKDKLYTIGIYSFKEKKDQKVFFVILDLKTGEKILEEDITPRLNDLKLIPSGGFKELYVFSSIIGESYFFFSNKETLYALNLKDLTIKEVYTHTCSLGSGEVYNHMLFINDDDRQLIVLKGEELSDDGLEAKYGKEL